MALGQATVETVMGNLIGSLVDVSAKFEALAAPVSKFVEALAPGEIQVFGLAMRDLNATIGTALLPVMQVFTEGVQRAAGILLPAMEHLQPAFRSLADGLMSFVMPTIQLLSHKMAGLADLMEGIGEALHILGDLFGVLGVIVLSVKDAIGAWVNSLLGAGEGGGLSETLGKLKDAVYRVMITLLTAAASIAKAFGADSFVKGLVANLTELTQAKGGAGGAAQNLAFKDFEQIGKDMALAAAQAADGGGGGTKDIRDYAKEAIAGIQNVADNGISLKTFLNERLPRIIEESIKAGMTALSATATEAADGLREKARNLLPAWAR